MIRFLLLFLLLSLPVAALAQTEGRDFVPLTNLPGITEVAGQPDLGPFLNNLYRLLIGAAAVIAVIQIMRAGIMFMTNKGSVSENEQARHLIQMSVVGLVLILSPVIVFSIINPEILNLQVNTSALQTQIGDITVSEGGGEVVEGDTDGDGDADDDDVPINRGEFYSALPASSVEMANVYRTACNDASIATNLREIIKSKRPKGPSAQVGPDGETVYTLFCESFSQNFTRYTLGVKNPESPNSGVYLAETEVAWAPGFQYKYGLYEQGCAADGGNLRRDADWAWSGYGNCSAEVEASVFEAHNASDETHAVNCQQVEYSCVEAE